MAEAGRLGWVKSQETRSRQREALLLVYLANPARCTSCKTSLPFEKKRQRFCSRSCAASHNNHRVPKRKRTQKACPCGQGVPARGRKWCSLCIASGLGRIPLDAARSEGTRRRYLLRTRPHRCEIPECGQTAWLDQPIPLEMDHIDGNSQNNTEANLRLICPNCHALQPTHKGKNRGRGRAARRRAR